MTSTTLRGKAHKFGDGISTDLIIPGSFLTSTSTAILSYNRTRA